jgi:hypothetical protein
MHKKCWLGADRPDKGIVLRLTNGDSPHFSKGMNTHCIETTHERYREKFDTSLEDWTKSNGTCIDFLNKGFESHRFAQILITTGIS